MLTRLVEEHNREHPRRTIELQTIASSEVETRITTRFASGDPVDWFESGGLAWAGYAQRGMIVELTPYLKKDRLDVRSFIPESVNTNSKESQVWGWPSTVSADTLAYNLDLLEAAGLKAPPVNPDDKSWTMERFQEYAVKLTRGREQFGLGALGITFWTPGTFWGQGPWDDAAKKAQMTTANYVKGLEFFFGLRDKQRVIPASDETATLMAGRSGQVFLSGKVGMQLMGPFLTDRLPFRWGLATLPYSGSGRNVSGRMWAHGWFMGPTPTARREATWEVFKWLIAVPDRSGRYVASQGHAVSPLLKGNSESSLKVYQERAGIDPRAYFLQAQHSRASGWGMLNYPNYLDVNREHDKLWAELVASRIGVGEYTRRAAELWDTNLVTRR
jgi:multiple sugar transport system substrate-binding protein